MKAYFPECIMRGMRIYTGQNVYEASKERLRRLFRTFNDITVSVS